MLLPGGLHKTEVPYKAEYRAIANISRKVAGSVPEEVIGFFN
jgi:hypothetical protein